MMTKLTAAEVSAIAHKMSEIAREHKNDVLSNAYARVSSKLESVNTPFAQKLTAQDLHVVRVFIHNYM